MRQIPDFYTFRRTTKTTPLGFIMRCCDGWQRPATVRWCRLWCMMSTIFIVHGYRYTPQFDYWTWFELRCSQQPVFKCFGEIDVVPDWAEFGLPWHRNSARLAANPLLTIFKPLSDNCTIVFTHESVLKKSWSNLGLDCRKLSNASRCVTGDDDTIDVRSSRTAASDVLSEFFEHGNMRPPTQKISLTLLSEFRRVDSGVPLVVSNCPFHVPTELCPILDGNQDRSLAFDP